ncbi:MAG TPA: MOSC N-terminal beta barrel domain-containing protein, partial [Bryobacteraceae bacterium]|nr:MOSC N-terminal beta barrel domain-containing protein [Bryobacteraceae bacterium]
MKLIGRVESVWRYPVKSMRGEQLPEAFVGFGGIYGDRLFAFRSSAAPKGFPYLTGREQEEMLLYQPRYRYPEKMSKPPNLAEAEA